MDLRSHRGDARARLQRHGRRRRREACRGRTSRCCSGRSRRTRTRWSQRCAGATIPYVVKGLNRLFDARRSLPCVGVFRYMAGLVADDVVDACSGPTRASSRDGDWAAALAVLEEGRDFDRGERWGIYNIQRLYLEFLAALGMREETVPRARAGRPRAASSSSTSSASSARRSRTSSRSTSTPSRSRSTTRSPTGSSTRRPTTTRSRTPTSGTRRRTR